MKVIELSNAFGLQNLVSVERPEGEAGPGQVKLAMRAATLNFRDLLMLRGHYDPRIQFPLVPCSDGVGEVVEIGEGVDRVAVGDRVCPIFCQAWIDGEPDRERLKQTLGGPLDGVLQERFVVSQEGVVKVPDYLSDEEAAALPVAGLTAWSALSTLGGVGEGDTVVLQGTGGVSIFGLQFAQLLGARTIITSSSDEKLERARQLGAWQTINYKSEPKWGKRVKVLTDGRGADHIVEVGGAGTLQESIKAIRPFGTISVIGVLSGASSELNIVPVLMQNVRLQGVLVGSRTGFESMLSAMEPGEMRPIIDKRFVMSDIRDAFEHMAAAKHFGKIAIGVGE
jgi:NADPH:quinone reductase-like Zn-dependent oxidoreductase